jgi:uncharacterized protein YndB with AHSA1/START domain
MATRRSAAREKAGREKSAKAARARTKRPSLRTARREFRDEIVVARTGRTRAEWFSVLDAFDCRAHGHKASAAHLMQSHGAAPWWAQAITVEYERARGIRSYGERADGFACTVQRALAVPADRAWSAFEDPAEVSAWTSARHDHRFRAGSRWRDAMGGRGAFQRVVPLRYVRFSWNHPRTAPRSLVEVEFVARAEDRVTVKLTHRRIRSEEEREALRSHWSWALDSLKSYVETGAPIPHDVWVLSR